MAKILLSRYTPIFYHKLSDSYFIFMGSMEYYGSTQMEALTIGYSVLLDQRKNDLAYDGNVLEVSVVDGTLGAPLPVEVAHLNGVKVGIVTMPRQHP